MRGRRPIHQEGTENETFFQWVSGVCYSLKTYESLCSPTKRNNSNVLISFFRKRYFCLESEDVPSPPIYGCLMITIDCSAKERVTVNSIVLAFVAANPNKKPHRLDLYGTWDPWQVPSNVDSPKWLCETQDPIHEELLQQFMREPINLNRQRNLKKKHNTNHARSYSQISASPLLTFLQSWQHLPLRNNDCWTETWAKHPPQSKMKLKTRQRCVLTHILSPEVKK